LGNIIFFNDAEYSQAAINGLALAQAILKDEAQRLAMPRPQLGKEGSWVASIG
jgi:hypothetical protein